MHPLSRFLFRCVFAAAILLIAARPVSAQPHAFLKANEYFQTGAGPATPDALGQFSFAVNVPGASLSNLVLSTPTGRTQSIPRSSADEFGLSQRFTTKAALDAAFPNGTYAVSATGRPTITATFAADLYPTAVPQLTNGTWNAGGLLVIDPTRDFSATLNSFPGYATAGVGGVVLFQSQGDSSEVNRTVVSNQTLAGLGVPVATTVPASFLIPAGTYTSGRVYEIEIWFASVQSFASPAGAPGGVLAANSANTRIYVAALASGVSAAPAPVIARQPVDTTARVGTSATFTVGPTFNGSSTFPANNTFFVEWKFNGQTITTGAPKYVANGAQLTINSLTLADAGDYSYRIVTTGGISTSNVVKLTVTTSPAIATQPSSLNVVSGTTAVFTIAATGVPEPTYQWRREGVNLPGATGASLVVPNATAALAGSYTCVVTNTIGSVTSAPASLTISGNPDFGRVVALSVLTRLAEGEGLFTVGASVGGAGTTGTKPVLVRAGGPTLGAAPFNIPGTLPDPKLDVFSGQTVIASNNDWAGTATLLNTSSAVGTFPFVSAASKDAALLAPGLASGGYTVQVSDVAGGSGTVIAELYDATPGASFTPATPRLIAVSVLKQIPASSILTVGFIIGGSTAKTMMIRASGPTLGLPPFNIPGVMGDPKLTLFNGASVQIGANDNWGGDTQIVAAASAVGAFALSGPTSKDAVILVTLPPGAYTAQATDGTVFGGGMALIEVYDVP
jgi:hypothetical protein